MGERVGIVWISCDRQIVFHQLRRERNQPIAAPFGLVQVMVPICQFAVEGSPPDTA